MSSKQLNEALKKQLAELDNQIYQLQGLFIQDTREFGNILKGFQNYIASKTARNQPLSKKQKIQTHQRLFSLSSIKSKTSIEYEDLMMGLQAQPQSSHQQNVSSTINTNQKRNRSRPSGGMNKSLGGKSIGESNIGGDADDGLLSEDIGYSMDEGTKGNSGHPQKRKKITKSGGGHQGKGSSSGGAGRK